MNRGPGMEDIMEFITAIVVVFMIGILIDFIIIAVILILFMFVKAIRMFPKSPFMSLLLLTLMSVGCFFGYEYIKDNFFDDTAKNDYSSYYSSKEPNYLITEVVEPAPKPVVSKPKPVVPKPKPESFVFVPPNPAEPYDHSDMVRQINEYIKEVYRKKYEGKTPEEIRRMKIEERMRIEESEKKKKREEYLRKRYGKEKPRYGFGGRQN